VLNNTNFGTKQDVVCPSCMKTLTHVLQIGKAWTYQCPECKRALKKSLVPEGFPVKHIEARPKKSKKSKVEEIKVPVPKGIMGEAMKETEQPTEGPPFRRPKSAAQILRELCTYHGLKEDFIEYVVRKAESKRGGLHPMELRQMLQDLESGIKTKRQAEYIVNDYMELLFAEKEKARQMGVPMVYPVGPYEEETGRSFYPTYPETTEYQRTQLPSYPSLPSYGSYPPGGQVLTPVQIQRMIHEAIMEDREKRKIEELSEKIVKLESGIGSIIEEKLEKLLSPQSGVPENVVTTEDLQRVLETEALKAQVAAEKVRSEMSEKLHEKTLKALEENIDRMMKETEERIKRIEESRRIATPDSFKTDEGRLLAEGIQELGSVIRDRRPLEEGGKILVQILKPEVAEIPSGKSKISKKVEGEDIIFDLIPEEFIEEEK